MRKARTSPAATATAMHATVAAPGMGSQRELIAPVEGRDEDDQQTGDEQKFARHLTRFIARGPSRPVGPHLVSHRRPTPT